MYSSVLVLSAELRGGIKWLLHKSVTLHKTVILPQIMVAHACAHQAFCTKIARSAKTAVRWANFIGYLLHMCYAVVRSHGQPTRKPLYASGVTRSMVIPGPKTEVIGESGSGGLGAVTPDAEKGLILHVVIKL